MYVGTIRLSAAVFVHLGNLGEVLDCPVHFWWWWLHSVMAELHETKKTIHNMGSASHMSDCISKNALSICTCPRSCGDVGCNVCGRVFSERTRTNFSIGHLKGSRKQCVHFTRKNGRRIQADYSKDQIQLFFNSSAC